MKRKNEDLATQLAFGELSGEAKTAAERTMNEDTSAKALHAEMAAMREDLQALKEIPEHQLSTERLRTRILAEGLKPAKARTPWFGVVWGPASAFCLAFAVYLLAHRGEGVLPNAPSGSSLDIQAPSSAEKPSLPSEAIAKNRSAPVISSTMPAKASKVAVSADSSRQNPVPEPTRDAGSLMVASKANKPVGALVAAKTSANSAGQEIALVPPSDALVLVGADQDEDTGAQRATEVTDSHNELISG